MPNDDLGQFPTPTTPSDQPTTTPPSDQTTPPANDTTMLQDINAPATDQISTDPFTTPPAVEPETTPTFEETPDEIPSVSGQAPTPISEPEPTPAYNEPTPSISEPFPATPPAPEPQPEAFQPKVEPQTFTPSPEPIYQAPPAEVPAAVVPKGGSSFGSLITIVLLLISGIAVAATVFLFSQSSQLQQQLAEVTQTLQQQQTIVTPTPTPSIIEFTTPTPTPEATPTASLTLTPTPTATISAVGSLPLANAPRVLQIAINHQPNAQLILIKIDNASSPTESVIKYFFRQDLTTKKYFYVMIEGNQEPSVVDNVFVTPDNNIPSLNDLVLGNKLGMDFDGAMSIAIANCISGCKEAPIKAQYIKAGENLIWQLSYNPPLKPATTEIIQINAESQAILYKSQGF